MKDKQLVGYTQSKQFGQSCMGHLPYTSTVAKQELHISAVLLQHFEVAHVFRYFGFYVFQFFVLSAFASDGLSGAVHQWRY